MKNSVFDFARYASLLAAVATVAVGLSVAGCSGGADKPVSIASEERVNEIVEMRTIYDSAKGDWNALSAEDKEKYTKLAGGADKAKTMWENMGRSPGAVPSN